jgi:hypothetical protein
MADMGEDKSGGKLANTVAVYFIKEEGLWYAKIGPDKDGRTMMASGDTPGQALSALLVSIHWGEYRFDPELTPA